MAGFMSVFQSAPPVRGATLTIPFRFSYQTFQSAPPVRGATSGLYSAFDRMQVSIRAPCERGDAINFGKEMNSAGFNPRPL